MNITINITLPATEEQLAQARSVLDALDLRTETGAEPTQLDWVSGYTGKPIEGTTTPINEAATLGVEVAAAPTPPAPPVEDEDGDLDSEGMPWDERIHSKNRTKNADGTWRLRRGVDADLVTNVKAERQADPEPPAPPVADESEPAAQVPPAPPVEDESEPAAPVPLPATFREFAMRIHRDGVSLDLVNSKIAEVAAALNREDVRLFAQLAQPDNAPVLHAVTAELWPES